MKTSRRLALVTFAYASLLVMGCSVSVDKSKDGDDQNVKIDTPLGGVHVNSSATTAADVGLPAYPGSQLYSKPGGDKPADVQVGFGNWQFHLKVVKYQSPDSTDKVIAFYRKALGRYGDVIECNGNTAVGVPSATREGLTCSDSENSQHFKLDEPNALKAGSKRHQHILGIEKNDGSGTVFSLVQLDLPAAISGDKSESN